MTNLNLWEKLPSYSFMKKNSFLIIHILLLLLFIVMPKNIYAETIFKDNFQNPSQWKFISDDVMGGLSTGSVVYETSKGGSIALLSGNVTIENNGGFIQIRRDLSKINLDKAKFIKVIVKGNNEKYFIHLRTNGMFLPWQYYKSEFITSNGFSEIVLPISEFERSGYPLAKKISPKNIVAIGLVAIGRNHQAELYVKELSFVE